MNIPKAYKINTNITIARIFNEVKIEANRLGFPLTRLDKNIYIIPQNYGTSECAGQARTAMDRNKVITQQYIAIREGMTHVDEDTIRQLFVHEVAHCIVPSAAHNREWQRVGNKLGQRWNITVHRYYNNEDNAETYVNACERSAPKRAAKYVIECKHCNKQWEYRKMCKTVANYERYKCPHCAGKLLLQVNP